MTDQLLAHIAAALPHTPARVPCRIGASGGLPSWFDVTGLAAASIGAAGAEIAALAGVTDELSVDARLASLWFDMTVRPCGWTLPSPWDPIAGDYATRDGWIQLHTNAPRHRAAALRVLDCGPDRAAVAAAVYAFAAGELEAAIVAEGGCAAELRDLAAWQQHPQGRAVATEPLIAWTVHDALTNGDEPGDDSRPLAGVRVLDLTRILAGPIATRFLAGFGADVLRIDPPDWDEPTLAPEVTLGKRCGTLNLTEKHDFDTLRSLLRRADVLVHGYRPGALDALGLSVEVRRSINPRLIDVSLSAYGHTGPWSQRRGFDSLVQRSCGIAAHGMVAAGAERPVPLPVQALDHATGYLMAAAVVHALRARRAGGTVSSARLSLARTAQLLIDTISDRQPDAFDGESTADLAERTEPTPWGDARRVRFPLRVGVNEPHWIEPPRALHSDPVGW